MLFATPAPAPPTDLGDGATWAGVLVALLVGIAGVVVAVVARRDARSANVAANEANDAAHEANLLAKAALVGDDIWWSLAWNGTGSAELINQGHDVAHNVRGRVIVDDETAVFGPIDLVKGQGTIRLSFPDARVALAVEQQRLDGPDVNDFLKLGYSTEAVANHSVSWRVTWDTPLGRTMPTDAQTFTEQAITPVSTTPPGVD